MFVRGAVVLTVALSTVALAGCTVGTSPSSSETTSATKSTLHGWIFWQESMPFASENDSDTSRGSALNAYLGAAHEPYSSAGAQTQCNNSATFREVKSAQLIVYGSNGETLEAIRMDVDTLQNSQTDAQKSNGDSDYSDFMCAVGWHSTKLPNELTYTLKILGHSLVVNGSDAKNAAYLQVDAID